MSTPVLKTDKSDHSASGRGRRPTSQGRVDEMKDSEGTTISDSFQVVKAPSINVKPTRVPQTQNNNDTTGLPPSFALSISTLAKVSHDAKDSEHHDGVSSTHLERNVELSTNRVGGKPKNDLKNHHRDDFRNKYPPEQTVAKVPSHSRTAKRHCRNYKKNVHSQPKPVMTLLEHDSQTVDDTVSNQESSHQKANLTFSNDGISNADDPKISASQFPRISPKQTERLYDNAIFPQMDDSYSSSDDDDDYGSEDECDDDVEDDNKYEYEYDSSGDEEIPGAFRVGPFGSHRLIPYRGHSHLTKMNAA